MLNFLTWEKASVAVFLFTGMMLKQLAAGGSFMNGQMSDWYQISHLILGKKINKLPSKMLNGNQKEKSKVLKLFIWFIYI